MSSRMKLDTAAMADLVADDVDVPLDAVPPVVKNGGTFVEVTGIKQLSISSPHPWNTKDLIINDDKIGNGKTGSRVRNSTTNNYGQKPLSHTGSEQNQRSYRTRAMLEFPLQYDVNGNDHRQTNKKNRTQQGLETRFGGLSMRPQSRLTTTTSFPIYTSLSQPSKHGRNRYSQYRRNNNRGRLITTSGYWNDEATCSISLGSSLRGRTGYANGCVDVQWSYNHAVPLKDTATTNDSASSTTATTSGRRTTTISTGVGIPPQAMMLPWNSGTTTTTSNPASTDDIDSLPNLRHSLRGSTSCPALRIGITTTLSYPESVTPTTATTTTNRTTCSAMVKVPMLSSIENNNMASRRDGMCHLTLSASTVQTIRLGKANSQLFEKPRYSQHTYDSPPPRFLLMNLQTQCTLAADPLLAYSSLPQVHTINGTMNFSPTYPTDRKHVSHQPQHPKQWTVQVGLSSSDHSKRMISPMIGWTYATRIVSFHDIARKLWYALAPNSTQKDTLQSRDDEKLHDKYLDIAFQWKGSSSWQLGGQWSHRNNSHSTSSSSSYQKNLNRETNRRKIGIGVTFHTTSHLMKTKSKSNGTNPLGLLSWIVTWTEGDFTLRVPILWTSSAAVSATAISYQQLFQFFYLSFVSSIIQDLIGQIATPVKSMANADEDEGRVERSQNARHERARESALLQQRFMERQARSRTESERKRNGLVIQKAVYYVPNRSLTHGDDTKPSVLPVNHVSAAEEAAEKAGISFDVTTPLQFWVSESKLELYGATRRRCMLGFYDISAFAPTTISGQTPTSTPATDTVDNNPIHSHRLSAWIDRILSILWYEKSHGDGVADNDVDDARCTPALFIHYDFEGNSYDITITDDDDVVLPSKQATKRAPLSVG